MKNKEVKKHNEKTKESVVIDIVHRLSRLESALKKTTVFVDERINGIVAVK